MADPTRLIGLHFFNPVAKMMLVEIVVGRQTRAELIAPAAAFVRQIDQLPLPVKSAPGFLVNRVLAPYLMAAMRCVDEGIAPETVDEAALAFGMPMGPIELADTVGLDICVAVGKMLAPDAAPPKKLTELVAAGHLGRKTKRGFYDYASGKPAKQAAGAVPAGLADRLIGPVRRRSEGGARRGHRRRRRSRRCRRDLRHRLRAVPRRSAALRRSDAGRRARAGAAVQRRRWTRAARRARPALVYAFAADAPRQRDGRAHVRRTPTAGRRRRAARRIRREEERRGKDLAQALSEGRARRDRRQRVRVGPRRVRGERRPSSRRAPRSRAWASRSPSPSSTRCRPRSAPSCRRTAARRARASR